MASRKPRARPQEAGHSYSRAVITTAGAGGRIAGLAVIAAFAFDDGVS
jgi:hypothetical protein